MASRSELQNDEQEALRLAMDGRISSVWTALPGIVESVDLSAMTVSVQPAIQGQIQKSDGSYEYVNLPLLVDVPIVFPRAGGFILTLPIAAGDEVLVVFASRCIDSWWQNGSVGVPMEFRMHDLSDGFAIPGPSSQPKKISAISSSAAQLRNEAGDIYLEIGAAGVKIKATTVTVEGNMNVTGNIVATGNVTAVNVVASTGATVGGKNFLTHQHSNVQNGPNNTGGVV